MELHPPLPAVTRRELRQFSSLYPYTDVMFTVEDLYSPSPAPTQPDSSFPKMAGLGWDISPTTGDGNCLFNALSHQVLGNEDSHAVIRTAVVTHMRSEAHLYMHFAVPDHRRSNRIANLPKKRRRSVLGGPTPDIFALYEARLQAMARGGTWGDHIEVQAFSNLYRINVVVFLEGVVQPHKIYPTGTLERNRLPHVFIAFHTYGHYSSVMDMNTTRPASMAIFGNDLPDASSISSRATTPSLRTDAGSSQDSVATTDASDAETVVVAQGSRKRSRPVILDDEDEESSSETTISSSQGGLKRIRLIVKEA